MDDRHPRQWQGRPCVYYIRRGGRIKIGWTENLESRMRRLSPCKILAVEPVPNGRTPQEWETRRHNQFSAERIRGERETEWFRPSARLERHVAEMARTHPVPVMPSYARRRRRTLAGATRTELPPESATERTGPMAPIPPDALPLDVHPLDAEQEVPAGLRRVGIKRFPAYDAWWMPTHNQGMMADHWPITAVGTAFFIMALYQGIGIYAVPIGLGVFIVSFLIGERMTSRAAIRRRSAKARRRGGE